MSLFGGVSAAAASQCNLNTGAPLPKKSQEKQEVLIFRCSISLGELLPDWHSPHDNRSHAVGKSGRNLRFRAGCAWITPASNPFIGIKANSLPTRIRMRCVYLGMGGRLKLMA
jgi:hypothetical protein